MIKAIVTDVMNAMNAANIKRTPTFISQGISKFIDKY